MSSMEYLKQAQSYAEERGDLDWFCHYYTKYRESFDVRSSAQRALWNLYNEWELIPQS